MSTILVLDNGASSIKAGLTSEGHGETRIIPNVIIRSKGDKETYIGHELEQCRDYASLHYRLPCEKGLIVDWDAQKAVWDGLMLQVFEISPAETSLLITEPYFNLPIIQDLYDQFVFEEYEFNSYHRCAPAMIPFGTLFNPFSRSHPSSPECAIVIDSGYSYTHVVPLVKGTIVWDAVVRIDVGGKLLTNQLKDVISFRQWNMMDETYVMSQVKEACCFVTRDIRRDLETCQLDGVKNTIVQEYILPNFSSHKMGRIRTTGEEIGQLDQVLKMNNERFLIPEILFRPDDIGLPQLGIAAAVKEAISKLPVDFGNMAWSNIGLIGGNCLFPGFVERLSLELRSLAPTDCEVHVLMSSNPITTAYESAMTFAQSEDMKLVAVTREEYLEYGKSIHCRKKFNGWNRSDLGDAEDVHNERPAVRARLNASEDDGGEEIRVDARRGRGRGRGRGSTNIRA